jgi:signal transduction histidine kinase
MARDTGMLAALDDSPVPPAGTGNGYALRQRVTIQERERQRLARDLHDTVGQHVAVLRLKLEALQRRRKGPVQLVIGELLDLADAIDRDLDAVGWELRPPVLQHLGLVRALNRLVQDFRTTSGIDGAFYSRGVRSRLGPDLEDGLYRIAHEALANVARHARATHASVLLQRRRGHLVLVVEDDGRGFEWPGTVHLASQAHAAGLRGVFERATLIGGRIEIESAPGRGTAVLVAVPLGS